MFYFSDFPEGNDLSHWVIYTGSTAIFLIPIAIAAFIWSLWRTKRVWWLSGLFFLWLIATCWSLIVAFTGFQQLNLWQSRLQESHSIIPGTVRLMAAAFNMNRQACQFWFGIVVAAFALLVIVGIWRVIYRFTHEELRKTQKNE